MSTNPAGRLYATAATTLTGGASTVALAGTSFLRGGMTTTNSGLVAPVSGWYSVSCGFTIVTGSGIVAAQIAINGTAQSQAQVPAVATAGVSVTVSDSVQLTAGQYVQMLGYQSSGTSTATYNVAPYLAFLSMSLISA